MGFVLLGWGREGRVWKPREKKSFKISLVDKFSKRHGTGTTPTYEQGNVL